MTRAPDYAQAIEGWRAWRIDDGREAARLGSIHFDAGWPPGLPLVATCRQRRRSLRHPFGGGPPDHGAPRLECGCGIYAATARGEAAWYASGLAPSSADDGIVFAIGRVLLWGAVVEHGRGWRAERAYPHRLYVGTIGDVPSERVDRIALGLGDYGVPVSDLDWELPRRGMWGDGGMTASAMQR